MKKFWQQPLVWGIGGALCVGLIIAGVLLAFRPQVPIPAETLKQLKFSLLYPPSNDGYVVDQTTINYNRDAGALIFHAKKANDEFVFSEQPTPDSINDIPEYYAKMTEKLNSYSDFESLNGKVSLTRPKELNGKQTAVFNGKGTLMFVRPSRDLSKDEWRTFFNTLVVKKQ
jgi:hypothetical protein